MNKFILRLRELECRVFGHKWYPKYQRHDHFYRITCFRCGARFTRRDLIKVAKLNVKGGG